MEQRIYNVSTVRLMRFLYALGFEKESYIAPSGKENWRFVWSEDLGEALDFYHYMRKKNKELAICPVEEDTKYQSKKRSAELT